MPGRRTEVLTENRWGYDILIAVISTLPSIIELLHAVPEAVVWSDNITYGILMSELSSPGMMHCQYIFQRYAFFFTVLRW